MPGTASGATITVAGTRIAVMPFASQSIAERDLHLIATAIDKALASAGFTVAHGGDVSAALRAVGCGEPVSWVRESCLRTLAREVDAGLVLGGTVNAIGALHEAQVALYGGRSGTALWSTEYQVRGGIEEFYLQMPGKLAADLPKEVKEPDPPPPPPPVALPGREPAPVADSAALPPVDRDCGIAPGFAVGVSGMFALGDPITSQSPYSLRLHAVYPTSKVSQARLKVGLPLNHNHKLDLYSDKKYPDVYVGAEHEWGWPGFAIGVGLGYTYMQYFVLRGYEDGFYPDSLYYAQYDPAHGFNVCLNLRGGRPNAGFYGRISWPLPFIFEDHDPDNYFVEGSAMAAFGGKHVKGGVGVMGMYKRREADFVKMADTTYYYRDQGAESDYHEFDLNEAQEFMALLPFVRIAALIAGHVVVSFNLELGGTIFPRSPVDPDDADYWQPSMGLDIVYSIGKLKGADVMDGTF